MMKKAGKLMHFRCPLDLVELLEADGANTSATMVRRLRWTFAADSTEKVYRQGLADGARAMAPLHIAMADLVQRQVRDVVKLLKEGTSPPEAVRVAAVLRPRLPMPEGSPKGGHKLGQDKWSTQAELAEERRTVAVWRGITEEDQVVEGDPEAAEGDPEGARATAK